MELQKAIENRRSIRKFTEEPIPVEDLKKLVKNATLAPNIANAEPWRFIAITNKELIGKMKDKVQKKYDALLSTASDEVVGKLKERIKHFSSLFNDAPAVVAVISQPYQAVVDEVLKETNFGHDEMNELRNFPNVQTIGAAVQNILLSAVDMGYGACWLTGPMVAKPELEQLLEVKHPETLFAFVALGKPAMNPKAKEKKPFDEVFRLIN